MRIVDVNPYFYSYFGSQEAQWYTIAFVVIVMILSIIASFYRRKKAGLDCGTGDDPQLR